MAKRKSIDEDTAALFMNGRSQAVRLPKAFRFEFEERVRAFRARANADSAADRGG